MTAVTWEPAGLQVPLGIGAQALSTPATRGHSTYVTLGPRLIIAGRCMYYIRRNRSLMRNCCLFCKNSMWKMRTPTLGVENSDVSMTVLIFSFL